MFFKDLFQYVGYMFISLSSILLVILFTSLVAINEISIIKLLVISIIVLLILSFLYLFKKFIGKVKNKLNICIYHRLKDKSIFKSKEMLKLLKDIDLASKNENMVTLHYQPIYNNRNLKIEKYEVLMRLNIDGKLIFPETFLPLAKKINKYKQLSKIVIEKAFDFFQDKDMEFSINLSLIDISDKSFQKYFFKKIYEYNISNKLVVEIVETEGIDNYEDFYDFIKKLKKIGCKVAVDDFGAGYSNLAYIIKISDYIDYIKFDGSLIKNVVNDSKMQLFVGNLKFLCDNLNVLTIAEYVENKDILKYLNSMGIDYSQGYHIGRPKEKLI